jgi:hypothetical protein
VMFRLQGSMIEETFEILRSCGSNKHECQIYWLSSWDSPSVITEIAHPLHTSSRAGLCIDSEWINKFWLELARRNLGVRVQIHTHPDEAYHSATDDEFPLVHSVGFLSLVIPNFAMGSVGMQDAYLTEMQPSGRWQQVDVRSRIQIDEH